MRLIPKDALKYCPVCGKILIASNIDEVANGAHDGYIFVHDNVVHSESDIAALEKGVN